jgi:hypothetical protein
VAAGRTIESEETGIRGWAWEDLNLRPLPYQFWPGYWPVGQGSTISGVVVGHNGSVCGGVAVTAAVSAF